ncbi:LuxR C-terminal-related transcriptional regulator [Cupriavidus oxalaticus]|uniref:LuxR C-terminal-related transcriptional regulator n=1 Tax=Cupriavidus oxalaticus TaxID=96344 RepID=UPI00318212F3
MRVAAEVVLSASEREALTALADAADTSARLAQRVRIVLLAAQGMQNKDIADQLGMGRAQVARWRERYVQWRLPGIENNLPRGAPPVKVDLAQLAELTARGRPDSSEPWSTRTLAETLGVSAATISRHWKAMGQEPPVRHRMRAQGASDSAGFPDFSGCMVDIVGLYVHGDEHALVLASRKADDAPGVADGDGTRRVGMAALLDALRQLGGDHGAHPADNPAPATVRPWLAFLRRVERAVHGNAALYLLCDNDIGQRHPAVRRWLARHPRFQACFPGPSASWPRTVQRCLRAMDTSALRHAMRTVPDLLACVAAYRADAAATQPFVWLAPAPEAAPAAAPVAAAVAAPDAATATVAPEPSPPAEPDSHDLFAGIDAARLTPPRTKDALLPRDALMARLQDARRHRCVVVHGQAGSGKTTTLLAWRRQLLSMDYDVTWLSLAADDNAPAHFCVSLLASVARADPAAARAIARPPGVAPGHAEPADAEIEPWIISLVQGLARHPRELVLILDDLHRVRNPRTFRAVQWLIDYAPPNVHVVLGSRTALPLSLERIRARGLLTEVGMRDLRFTAEETERFLAGQLGGIDARDVAEIHRFTDGWATGLQRVVAELRSRSHPDRHTAQARVVTALTGYFEREVLAALPGDDLEWLASTALCQRLCGPLCAAVLGRPDDAAALSARLARLETDQLFVTRESESGHDIWYRLHPLLRDVLAARLGVMPASTRQALHGAAGAWFHAHGMIDEAVHHAVQAGDVDAAAGMVEACAYDLLARGDLTRLVGLLRRLPEAVQRGRFGLLLVSAYYAMYTARFDAAQESLARIAAQRKTLDSRQRYAEALIRAGLALQQDDVDTVLAMVPSLRDGIPAEADDFSWSCRSNILGWAYIYQGQYDQARAVVDEARARGAGTRSRLLGDCIAAMSVAVEGRPDAAEQTVRELLESADARGTDATGLSCMTAGLLADILYEVNDTEAAVRLLESRMNVLERASLPDTVLHACRVLARAHWLAGRRAQAMASIDRLEAYADRFGMDRLLAEAHALRLRRHHELGEMQSANTALSQLEAIGKRHAEGRTETARRVLAVVRQARDDMLLPLRDYATCATRMAQDLESASLHPVRRAGLEMQLALAQHRVGGPQAAHSHLANALSLGHRFGLVRTLLDIAPDLPAQIDAIRDTCDTCGGAPTLDPVLAFYATRLRTEAASTGAIAPGHGTGRAPADAAGLLSEREREVLDLAAQAMPNKKIAMVLGLAQETVKWHLKNIYAKLGVAGRGGAAARLRDLEGTPKR